MLTGVRQYFWTVVVGGGSLDLATLWHGIDAAELDRVRAHLERAIAERDDFELEHRYARPDGSTGWVQQRGIVARDHRGNAVALRGIATDVTERRHAEHELRDELAVAQHLLTVLSKLTDDRLESLSAQLLDAAVMIMHSDFASVQIFDAERDQLSLVAHRGFTPEAAERWRVVRRDTQTPCGIALATGSRVVIADVGDLDPMLRRLGIRSVQSTPLISRNFELLGVISTHWRTRHEPTARELRLFDVLARQASDLLERARTEEVLRKATDRDAFRTALTESLRTASDPESIQATTSRLLGEYLQVSRAYYADLDLDSDTCTMGGCYFSDGAVPLSKTFRLGALGQLMTPEFRAGVTAVSGGAAHIAVPLVIGGKLVGALAVHAARPRQWGADEIALVEETAERTWSALERRRAQMASVAHDERRRAADRATGEIARISQGTIEGDRNQTGPVPRS